MSAILYLTPTLETALAHIIEHVRRVRRERPLAPLTFLLPSGDAIRQLRLLLGNVIAVRFLQFYNLSSSVLSEAGSATHEMSDLATRGLVRGILWEMHERGQLTTFGEMIDKPGFIEVLVEWLREMKTQAITAESVVGHAAQTGKQRDVQLAALYTRYEAALRQADCSDLDGLLWLATEALERNPGLLTGVGELVLAGFDQFSPVQLRMVSALASRVPLSVYLIWDEMRPANSLALGRLAPTLEALRRALSPVETALPPVERCGPALEHIRRFLFEPRGEPAPDENGCIHAVAAPSAEAEVRQALRRIKQLLLNGVREEQVALLAPQPGTYRSIVATVSREYGVPVACETTLGENPCVAALLNLLSLAPAFSWRQTFDALRSPYVKQPWLDAEQIACLDALTRERPVVAGQDQWWYALGQVERTGNGNGEGLANEELEDEDRAEPMLIERLEPEVLEGLRAGLRAFFEHLTPPGSTQARHVAWIQDALLGVSCERDDEQDGAEDVQEDGEDYEPGAATLQIINAAARGEGAARDLPALQALLQALRIWLDAGAMVDGLGLKLHKEPLGVDKSLGGSETRELLEWLPAVPVRPDRKHAAVRFGPLEANRAVTVDHLFVLGLGEGELPRQAAPDPLYTASERASHPLPLVRLGTAEDASLWWQVLCNCQCSLTLLRSRYDANGAEWQPSPYWSAVVDLVEGLEGRVEKPPLSVRPCVQEAASYGELLEALAHDGAAAVPDVLARPWKAVHAAREVAAARDGWGAPGNHEGIVRDQALLAHLERRYGPGRSWSVSRLNRLGTCPYAFWAQQGLRLEALADPIEGFDALQRGSLVHKILERLFVRLVQDGLAPGPDAVEHVSALLDEVCDAILPRAAERYGFRPGPLWDHEQDELRGELRAYMEWECEPKQAGAFRPFAQELEFGMGATSGVAGRVLLAGFGGAEIALRGVIDRIDSDGAGRFRVIDYKTGGKKFDEEDILAGRALQSALYAWVVEALTPNDGDVVETCYRHTGSRYESGMIKCGRARENELVLRASAKAVQLASAVVRGWFPAAPSRGSGAKACDEQCDYLGLCRVTRHGVRKAQHAGVPLDGQRARPSTPPGELLPGSARDASSFPGVPPTGGGAR